MSDAQAVNQELAPEQTEVKRLKQHLEELLATVNKINDLRDLDMFRFLSKAARNELIQDMIELSECIYDSAKRSRNLLKKNKRIRVPDELVDLLLKGDFSAATSVASCYSSNTGDESDDDSDAPSQTDPVVDPTVVDPTVVDPA